MLFTPGSVEGFVDLEMLALQRREDAQVFLDLDVQMRQDLTDPHVGLRMPGIIKYSDMLTGIYAKDPEDYAAQMNVYRSANFGLYPSNLLCRPEHTWAFSIHPLFELPTTQDTLDYAVEAPAQYLSARSNLDGLVGKYLPYVSPQSKYWTAAEHTAGLTLMLVDNARLDDFGG